MLAAVGILVGFLAGLAAGGKPEKLADVSFRFGWILLAAFAGQAALRSGALPLSKSLVVPMWAVCSLAAVCVALAQDEQSGMRLYAAGSVANLLVVLANQGMPASASSLSLARVASAVSDSEHFYVLSGKATHFGLLGDIVPSPGGLASLGDVLIAVGVAVFITTQMTRCQPPVNGRNLQPFI